jgi:hypothetical protein
MGVDTPHRRSNHNSVPNLPVEWPSFHEEEWFIFMNARFTSNDVLSDGSESADQRDLLRLVRIARTELSKRMVDIGCMNPDEINDFFRAFDQIIDLHVSASLHDDRVESLRQKMQRIWIDE